MSLLDSINSPDDLKKLKIEQLPQLCDEIRSYLINTISQSGGHLSSNLGSVELTIALHYTYNSPEDIFIWDVGHQTYTHKILTGRKNQLHTVRQFKGLSGFPRKEESPHDSYNSGHAGNSISLGVGEAVANKIKGSKNRVISIIGDASIATGTAFEAMNHAGGLKIPFLVLLNDNEMSISKNVGALSYVLTSLINTRFYKNWMHSWLKFLRIFPIIGEISTRMILRFASNMKSILTEHQFFEELGFRYLGPLDGHDVIKLVHMFRKLENLEQPTLLHLVTKKGKGYIPAENDPTAYHGVNPFEKATGIAKLETDANWPLSEFAGQTLSQLAAADSRVCVITPAMMEGSGLTSFAGTYPERFFDTGITEQHATSFSAALAHSGLKPFLCIYSTFLQRGYDQLIHDICLMNLPVRIVIDRAGIVGGDGETHQGIYDIGFLSPVPNLKILSASNELELMQMLEFMHQYNDGPIAVRFPKLSFKKESFTQFKFSETDENFFKAKVIQKGLDIILITEGVMLTHAVSAAEQLKKTGINCEILSLRSIKPLDWIEIENRVRNKKFVFTIENHIVTGGIGQQIKSHLMDKFHGSVFNFAYPELFIEHGSILSIEKKYQMDAQSIFHQITDILGKYPKVSNS